MSGEQKFHSSSYECQWRFRKRMQTFYEKLSGKQLKKRDEHYSIAVPWVKRNFMFSLINSIILCIRGGKQRTNYNKVNL